MNRMVLDQGLRVSVREWSDRLKALAKDRDDGFHLQLRLRIGKKATPSFERRLKDYTLMTPGIVSRILEIGSGPGGVPEVRELGHHLLAYLNDPKDALPESVHGLFGCLDDAYLVARVYLRALELQGVPHESADQDDVYRERSREFVRMAMIVLPPEAGRTLERQARVVRELIQQKEIK